jgi:bifunctional non-homologous end joining protein LigD
MAEETITLYFREGSSDKVYKASLKQSGGSWSVPFEYGRRGSSMQTGEKVSGVSYEKAKDAYDKIVKEKTAKGYKPGPDSEEYVPAKGTASSVERADVPLPMLLQPIDPSDEYLYLSGPQWVAQEKYDGKRIVLDCKPGEIFAMNRKGKGCGIPKSVEADAMRLATGLGHITLDGELLGDKFVAFDMLRFGGDDIKAKRFLDRWNRLQENVADECKSIVVAPIIQGPKEKKDFIAKLRADKAEGIVFKDAGAAYSPAIRGPSAVKFKFYATASCIVTKVNDKRSVALGLMDEAGGDIVGVGNCTVPADQNIPKADDIVEVRYLYAYKGGSLYQPVLLGVRDDLSIDDCAVKQLKYKKDTDEEDS